jgi:ATP-dependent RNA helicase DeaD
MDKKPFPELGLSPELLAAVAALGFDQPAPIQAQAIPPALEGRDVVGQSQTGSGKTMAFAMPVVQRLDATARDVRALIMCPTRELAMQVCEEVSKLTVHKRGLKAIPIYGGATYERQIRGLRDGAQIVVGTPGRILDFVDKGILRTNAIEMLVFDEADEMLDMGFREEIERLMKAIPVERQTLFFSATIDGPIRRLIESYTRNPALITVEHKAMTVPTVEQRYYEVMSRSKVEALCRILDLENPHLTLVFANTKRAVDDAADALVARGYAADRLHGDLNQIARDRVMRNFRSGNVEVLVATDVAARGLDVDTLDLVINLDLPYDEEDYVHRIGRTGRAGRSGKAISLVTGREIFLLQRIQRFAKVRIERHRVPTLEEVEGKRVSAHFEKLRLTLEEGKFGSHEAEVQKLLDAGNNSTDIASALMHLWISEGQRETGVEIQEDRPQPAYREQRPGRPMARGEGTATRPHATRPPGPPINPDAAFTRLFINVGAMDEVTPREISGALYNTAALPQGAVGKIEIYEKCSYVGVATQYAEQVMRAIGESQIKGRRLRMDVAEKQDGMGEPGVPGAPMRPRAAYGPKAGTGARKPAWVKGRKPPAG